MYLYDMHLVITEKQLKKIVRLMSENQQLTEQGAGEGTPEAGTSSDGEKKTGASKWESGVTRGPANQIAVTTWAEVVGSKITRGKANPLSEQLELLGYPAYQLGNSLYQEKKAADAANAKLIQILRPDGKYMYAPEGTKILSFFESDAMDGSRFKDSLKTFISKEKGGLGNSQTQAWIPRDWSKIVALNSVSQFKTPDGKQYQAVIRHPQLDKLGSTTWEEFYKLYPNPNGWKFYYYLTIDGKEAFKGVTPTKTVLHHLDEWKYYILAGASILAAVLIPGIGGLIVAIGIDLFAAGLQVYEGDTIGAAVSAILAFVPVIGKVIPGLKVSKEVAENLAKGLAPLDTEAKIIAFVEELPQQQRYFMQKLLAEDPKKLSDLIAKEMYQNVKPENVLDVVSELNKLIKNKTLDKVKAETWYKSLGLKRFGFDLGVSGLVAVGGGILKFYLAMANTIEAMNITVEEEQVKIGELLEKIYQNSPQDFENKIVPAIEKYSQYADGTEEEINKLNKIQLAVIKAYSQNPNQDLTKIADNANK